MADLFDAQRDSAAFQGELERVKTSQRNTVTLPSGEPLFHTDHQGNLVDRSGSIVREKLAPLQLSSKPAEKRAP